MAIHKAEFADLYKIWGHHGDQGPLWSDGAIEERAKIWYCIVDDETACVMATWRNPDTDVLMPHFGVPRAARLTRAEQLSSLLRLNQAVSPGFQVFWPDLPDSTLILADARKAHRSLQEAMRQKLGAVLEPRLDEFEFTIAKAKATPWLGA